MKIVKLIYVKDAFGFTPEKIFTHNNSNNIPQTILNKLIIQVKRI